MALNNYKDKNIKIEDICFHQMYSQVIDIETLFSKK